MKKEERIFSGDFCRRNYKESLDFFKECKPYILISAGLFFIFFLIGFLFPIFFREAIFDYMRGLVTELEGVGIFGLISFIFFNNLKASLIAIVTGIGIGVFPLIILVTNGYLIGFVGREAVNIGGIFVLWQLLPHGIFELPAVIFSIAIGLKIGRSAIDKNRRGKIREEYRKGFQFFLFVIVPLLAVAAIIEGLLVGFLS